MLSSTMLYIAVAEGSRIERSSSTDIMDPADVSDLFFMHFVICNGGIAIEDLLHA